MATLVNITMKRSTRMKTLQSFDVAAPFLRLAMGTGLLSAVADRFGFWGAPGTPSVSWGNFHNFLLYTAKLNPWCPAECLPFLGIVVTIAEAGLGTLLILGFATRISAFLTGMLTLIFGTAMTFVLGVHAPLNYSVFVFAAASFLLAGQTPDNLSIDWLRKLNSSKRDRKQH